MVLFKLWGMYVKELKFPKISGLAKGVFLLVAYSPEKQLLVTRLLLICKYSSVLPLVDLM